MASSSRPGTVIGSDITVKSHEPMKRSGYGRVGRAIRLKANFFEIKLPKQFGTIFQYTIAIDCMRFPENANRKVASNKVLTDISSSSSTALNRSVMKLWCKRQKISTPLAYDGRKIAYSAVELDHRFMCGALGDKKFPMKISPEEAVDPNVPVNPNLRVEDCWFRIAPTTTIEPRDVLRSGDTLLSGPFLAAIDAVLAIGPLSTHVQVGRSFYHPEGSQSLSEGVEAWRGFYQSARLSMNGVLLNMDESRTPFWGCGGQPLWDLLNACNIRIDTDDDQELKKAGKTLFGLKVRAKHSNIVYRIHGFSMKSANESTFENADGNLVSVSQYIRAAYGITLLYGQFPCVVTNPKKNTLMPIELLHVYEKQRLTRALTPQQTSSMIKCAATNPRVRAQGAESAMRRVDHNKDPTCKQWGITVDKQMMTVPARILPAPDIQYRNRAIDKPMQGVWNRSHQQKLYLCPAVYTWCVVNLTRAKRPEIDGFVRELVETAKNMGFQIHHKPFYFAESDRNIGRRIREIRETFQDRTKGYNNYPLQLMLIVKYKQDTEIYNKIKFNGDIEAGVATQVMLVRHLRPRQRTYYGNLLLKINSKLGGKNFYSVGSRQTPKVPFANRPHIILGADVTHPTGDGKSRPSVAAVVGSRDPLAVQYSGSIRNVPGRKEIIDEMGEMFMEVYDRWFMEHNKTKQPKQPETNAEAIIMFRDGVSEGQFAQVIETEIAAIRRACYAKNPNWNPKITYIICTKRHHARFFPQDKRDGDRNMNCLPGTIVDQGVTSKQYYDFFLNSHAGIQGTSRPSKYTVLLDENNIQVDALQAYVYGLAHNYVRCNRSVSMVNSAYYAHLLAFRGRAYLTVEGSDTASMGSSNNEGEVLPTAKMHDKLGKRLFFV